MRTRILFTSLVAVSLLSTCLSTIGYNASATAQTAIPKPSDVLGFTPGDDRKLASWDQVVKYFERLDESSDRVNFTRLGNTSMGRPFVMATISAPENLARLDEYKKIQDQLADPRELGPAGRRDQKAAELIARGKSIVLITCGIHSTEVGSYLSSTLIAHRLASSNDSDVQNILKNTIILLVPSLNPDGVDIVKNWYDKTLGTPYEGTEPPELYHKYTGHDNNRDWYQFTQVETQLTVDKIHNVWHPQIVHDIHQQGAIGSRLFLPPYMKPVEPNVPKQIVEGYTQLGNAMASDLRAQGFKGITTDSTYDAWTPSRAYSHYHGGVRILSETASARIATPIKLRFEDLRSREGYDPQKESPNFGPVWRGGDWGLRDITSYMTAGAFSLLKHASDNREQWLRRFYEIGKDAIKPIPAGETRAYIIPRSENQGRLTNVLVQAGVELEIPNPFTYGGRKFEMLTAIVKLDQPYGKFAKALLEAQHYPDLRDSTGHPIPPYDVTAHSLAMLMGVEVIPVKTLPKYRDSKVGGVLTAAPEIQNVGLGLYQGYPPSMDEGWTRWMLEDQRVAYKTVLAKEIRSGNLYPRFKSIVIPDQVSRSVFNGYRAESMPAEYTGGLGTDGVKALREFVEAGGTLVCLNRASDFAIDQFKLPVRDVVAGLPRTDFYVPGSILSIELDTSHPLARGMSRNSIAWVEDSPVFEVVTGGSITASQVKVVGSYPVAKEPLLSGWLLGGNRIKGKAALVEVQWGKGRIVLFGFRPQYRAQSMATYPLLFNAIGVDK
jgi:hypothetical protein